MSEICCACALIKGSKKYPDIRGRIFFRQIPAGVLIKAEIFNLPNDRYIFAFHIHQGNKCSGNDDDPFSEADGHFNPDNSPHPYHKGDLPPLFASKGYARMSFLTGRFRLNEIIGKTIIIHSGTDDFSSQPSGNSGEKIACGEIL